MRDAINNDECDRLVAAVKAGKTWDEVRGMLPGVDPNALDRGFKVRVFKEAGMEPMFLEPIAVEQEAPVVNKRRKG